jgi:hypothetical protein
VNRSVASCLALGCIALAAIAACSSSTPSEPGDKPRTISVVGALTQGVECPALRGDDGQLYTLLGDLGGFRLGDRVRVSGPIAEANFCMQGTTVKVESIAPAGP